jgi:hypothetical protein
MHVDDTFVAVPGASKKTIALDEIPPAQPSVVAETCELERKKKKAVSVAVDVITFAEHINPKDYPTLHSKHICLQTDTKITAVLRDILKLSKKVKSVDLVKVLHYNDSTTSLVEVPCSAKQSGFKKQARRSRWVHQILQCVRRYSKLELLDGIEREGGDDDDDEFAFTDDDAARWLITYLGECFPSEFVKSDLTPEHITKAREYAKKALEVWQLLRLSVTPKCHRGEDHACNQLELLKGIADFCEDWVEQLHQLGLKNNRRKKTIRNKERKYKLYTHWEQLSGNRNVQRMKKEVNQKRKRNLQSTRGADTAAALLVEKTYHREAALVQDNSQWTGENPLLSPEDIIRLDELDRLQNNNIE